MKTPEAVRDQGRGPNATKGQSIASARAWADREVTNWVSMDDPTLRRSAAEMFLWWALGCAYVEGPNGPVIVMYPEFEKFLHAKALEDPHARNLLRRVIVSKLLAKARLSDDESSFAALLLANELPVIAKRRGRDRSTLFERNFWIIMLMHCLIYIYGMRPIRNDETNRISAADLVASAFEKVNKHEVTYRTVKEIWLDKRLRREFRAIRRVIALPTAKEALQMDAENRKSRGLLSDEANRVNSFLALSSAKAEPHSCS